jgi:hypothetical protein
MTPARQTRSRFPDDNGIRTAQQKHDVRQHPGIGQELDPAIPFADIGNLVETQVLRPAHPVAQMLRHQPDQRFVVGNHLTGYVRDTFGSDSGLEQLRHPLLHQGCLANLSPARERVDSGFFHG